MYDSDNYTDYCLKSSIVYFIPSESRLESYQSNIYDLVRNSNFRNVCNEFYDKCKEDTNENRSWKNLILPTS